MNEALAQVTSRKCLTHAALDEDCNRVTTTNNTPFGCSWFERDSTKPTLIQRSDALYWLLFCTDPGPAD